jgi:hypothetical protein
MSMALCTVLSSEVVQDLTSPATGGSWAPDQGVPHLGCLGGARRDVEGGEDVA